MSASGVDTTQKVNKHVHGIRNHHVRALGSPHLKELNREAVMTAWVGTN